MADDYLTLADLAQLLGVKPNTVSFYRTHSRPGGRYEADPFPTADRVIARSPLWVAGRADEIKAWNGRRPGQGSGGGRPARTVLPNEVFDSFVEELGAAPRPVPELTELFKRPRVTPPAETES